MKIDKIEHIKLYTNEIEGHMVLSIVHMDENSKEYENNSFLSSRELKILSQLKHANGKRSYQLGRFAAKKAFQQYGCDKELDKIEIKNGIFEQPYIDQAGNVELSLSHCENVAIAAVYDKCFIAGVDVEKIRIHNYNTLDRILTDKERNMLQSNNIDKYSFVTSLWSIKEALSKCLKTGFTLSPEIMEVSDINLIEYNLYTGAFLNFGQYKYYCAIANGLTWSIVIPKKTSILYKSGGIFFI